MRAPHASSALAVNAFALWRSDPHLLQFADRRGFTAIRFEQQCPTGLDGTPAYFDLFAEAEGASFGVEIKCLEYLTRPAPKYLQGFTEAIEAAHARFGASTHGWLGRVQLLRSTPDHYEVLFAAQLVKQALALSYCNPQSQVSLAYLFWEPSNWRDYDVFRRHHAELDDLAGAVTGDHVSFWFQSFTALFRQWQVQSSPPWCRERSSRALRRGYRQLKHGPA